MITSKLDHVDCLRKTRKAVFPTPKMNAAVPYVAVFLSGKRTDQALTARRLGVRELYLATVSEYTIMSQCHGTASG